MRLFIIRHGKAEDRDPARWPDDGLRPLTERGHADARQLGARLAALDLVPERCWTSPLVRAAQTAQDIASGAGEWPMIEDQPLLGMEFAADALLDAVRRADAASCALIGHEPDLSFFVSWLIGAPPAGAIAMKKGSLALVEFSGPLVPGHGTLLALVPSRFS